MAHHGNHVTHFWVDPRIAMTRKHKIINPETPKTCAREKDGKVRFLHRQVSLWVVWLGTEGGFRNSKWRWGGWVDVVFGIITVSLVRGAFKVLRASQSSSKTGVRAGVGEET